MSTTYSVQFVGHVIQDEFTEYHMKVVNQQDSSSSWLVRRRYREFRDLHDNLKMKYGDRVPPVPGKKMWGNQDPDFVRQRQDQLQVYMNKILAIEPDCRTRVLQQFLEIKRPGTVATTPVPAASPTRRPGVSPAIPQAELGNILAELERTIFDLSSTPALIDQQEYETRRKKYDEILSSWTAERMTTEKKIDRTTSVWAKSAWGESHVEAKAAIDAALGKNPIGTESDLVAFFGNSDP